LIVINLHFIFYKLLSVTSLYKNGKCKNINAPINGLKLFDVNKKK
jgi:hypothetical protein